MLEVVCILLLVLLIGLVAFLYVHIKQQQQQAYIHGAIAGAAFGVTALYVLKAQPDAAANAARDILQANPTLLTNPNPVLLKQRVSNLTDIFADVFKKDVSKDG